MRLTGSLALLLLVAAATGAVAYWRWPELGPALEAGRPVLEAGWPVLATALGGLLALHAYAVARLARLEGRATDAADASGGESPKRGRPTSSKSPKPEGKAKPARTTAPQRTARQPSPDGPAADEEPEKVEEFLRVVLDDADAQDVSFLPPYASDEAEEVSFLDPYASDEGGEDLSKGVAAGAAGSAVDPERDREAHLDAEADAADAPSRGDPEEAAGYRNVPIPRHFALGTVAIIKQALTPAEVAEVLVEQRKRPRERFGELAVEMGLLSDAELQTLLVAQQQGLFTDEEIRDARGRIKAFRELEATGSAQ